VPFSLRASYFVVVPDSCCLYRLVLISPTHAVGCVARPRSDPRITRIEGDCPGAGTARGAARGSGHEGQDYPSHRARSKPGPARNVSGRPRYTA